MSTLIEQTKSQQVVVVQHVLADLTLQLGELHLELRYFLYCLEVLLEFVLSEARDFEVAHEGDEQIEYEGGDFDFFFGGFEAGVGLGLAVL